MKYNKILIISQDLIIANHLGLILGQENFDDFFIIQDVNSASELLKFGGYQSIFLFDFYNINMKTLNILNESKAVIYFILNKHHERMDIEKFIQQKNVEVLKMPFTRLEVKEALASGG